MLDHYSVINFYGYVVLAHVPPKLLFLVLDVWFAVIQCCWSEIFFFGSGSDFLGNFGSGSGSGSDPTSQEGGKSKILKQNWSTSFILKKTYVKPTCGFLFSLLYRIIDSYHWVGTVLTEQISCYFSQWKLKLLRSGSEIICRIWDY